MLFVSTMSSLARCALIPNYIYVCIQWTYTLTEPCTLYHAFKIIINWRFKQLPLIRFAYIPNEKWKVEGIHSRIRISLSLPIQFGYRFLSSWWQHYLFRCHPKMIFWLVWNYAFSFVHHIFRYTQFTQLFGISSHMSAVDSQTGKRNFGNMRNRHNKRIINKEKKNLATWKAYYVTLELL